MLIRNKRTGAIINVQDKDLQNYNISQPNVQLNESAQTQQTGLIGMEKRDRGNTGVGGFATNLITDVGENVGGLLALPGMALNLLQNPSQAPEFGKNLVSGVVKDYGSLVNDPLGEVYNRPVSTALNVLPFLQAFKKISAASKAGKVATVADTASDASRLGKTNVLTKAGEQMKGSVGKIYLKPSAYSAAEEVAVRATLDKLGIKGPTAKQFSAIGPKMGELGTVIDDAIKLKPKVPVTGAIKKSFTESFKRSFFGEGLGVDDAFSQLDDVAKREYGKGINQLGSFELNDLRLKANQAYKGIANRVKNGTATPEQLAIAASRDALTKTLSKLHPEVAEAISDQANLFKAVGPLNTARKTVPTTRAAGFTIPKVVEETGKTVGGEALIGAGNFINSPTGKLLSAPGRAVGTALKPSNLPLTTLLSRNANQPQNPDQQQGDQVNQEVGSNDITQQGNQQQIIPNGGLDENFFKMAMLKDLTTTGGKNMAKIEAMQKIFAPAKKQLSAVAAKEVVKANAASSALNRMENELLGKKGDISKIWKAKIGFAPGAQTYRSDWGSVIDAIGSFRTGAAYTPEQRSDYAYMLPQLGDSKADIKTKIDNLRAELEGYREMMNNTSSGGEDILQSILNP